MFRPILINLINVVLILCFLALHTLDDALRVTRFKVPDQLQVGQSTQLVCEFEINRGERLYSLRWYLNDIEFFRFEPRAEQRVQLFPLPQLRLDVSQLRKN